MDGLRALVALHAELQQSVAKVREVREEAKLALRRGSQAMLELRQKFARSAAAKGAAAAARLDGAKARLGARTLALTLTLTLTLTCLLYTSPSPRDRG